MTPGELLSRNKWQRRLLAVRPARSLLTSWTGTARVASISPSTLTAAELAAMIDHTLLKPEATADDVRKLCAEAKQHRFASVCVNGAFVALAAEVLNDCGVNPIAVVGFPLGASSSLVKAFEATDAVNRGAREIDMVLNVGALKSRERNRVRDDICGVVESVKPLPVKV